MRNKEARSKLLMWTPQFLSALVWLFVSSLCWPLLAFVETESAEVTVPAVATDEPIATTWWQPELGLARALKLSQPVLLVIESPADPAPMVALEEQLLSRSTARALEKVVAIRVLLRAARDGGWEWPPETKPTDPQQSSERWSRTRVRQLIEKTFGKPKGDTTIAILDLFGRKRAQLEGKKISGSALRKALKLASRECTVWSRKMAGQTQLVDKATLLLQRKDTAGCCRQLEQAAKLKLPVEAPPEQRRLEVLGLVEKQWRQEMAKAKELDRKNRLGEAAAAYEKILKDFPHDPWEKEVRTEIGKVWRRIQGPGGGL